MQKASNYAFKTVRAATLLGQRITPSPKLTPGLSDCFNVESLQRQSEDICDEKRCVCESLLMC